MGVGFPKDQVEDAAGATMFMLFSEKWMGKNFAWTEAMGREWCDDLGNLIDHVRKFERERAAPSTGSGGAR